MKLELFIRLHRQRKDLLMMLINYKFYFLFCEGFIERGKNYSRTCIVISCEYFFRNTFYAI